MILSLFIFKNPKKKFIDKKILRLNQQILILKSKNDELENTVQY